MITKTKTPAEPFRVPDLAESDAVYAELQQKQVELTALQATKSAELHALEKSITADTSREVAPGIAALLGDAPSGKALSRKRAGEMRADLNDLAAALEVLRVRIADRRTIASKAACAAVRPEYASRVRALAETLKAAQAAREHYEQLIDDLDAQDIARGSLVPMQPLFLGDRRDGHVDRWLRAAKEAGYVE